MISDEALSPIIPAMHSSVFNNLSNDPLLLGADKGFFCVHNYIFGPPFFNQTTLLLVWT